MVYVAGDELHCFEALGDAPLGFVCVVGPRSRVRVESGGRRRGGSGRWRRLGGRGRRPGSSALASRRSSRSRPPRRCASDLISFGWTTNCSTCAAGAPAGVVAAEQPAADLAGLLPHLLGARHLRDRPRRARHVLAVDDLDRGDAEHLVAQAGGGAIEVGELLGGDQHGQARLAPAREQRDHVVGAERRELVDRDRRRLGERAAARARPADRPRRDQVLDDQRAELRRELAVRARVEAEQDDLRASAAPRAGRSSRRSERPAAPGTAPVCDSVRIASRVCRPRIALSWSGVRPAR